MFKKISDQIHTSRILLILPLIISACGSGAAKDSADINNAPSNEFLALPEVSASDVVIETPVSTLAAQLDSQIELAAANGVESGNSDANALNEIDSYIADSNAVPPLNFPSTVEEENDNPVGTNIQANQLQNETTQIPY